MCREKTRNKQRGRVASGLGVGAQLRGEVSGAPGGVRSDHAVVPKGVSTPETGAGLLPRGVLGHNMNTRYPFSNNPCMESLPTLTLETS